jgi:hypothetical protein
LVLRLNVDLGENLMVPVVLGLSDSFVDVPVRYLIVDELTCLAGRDP